MELKEVYVMKKHVLFPLIAAILVLMITGCSQKETTEGPRLVLSCVTAENSITHIPAEDLNGNLDTGFSYHDVTEFAITIDGKPLPLETAIADGRITAEELWAFARIDARNGYCTEKADSHNGFSWFIYQYPDVCDLYFSYDVYETPSGKNYAKMYFDVYAFGKGQNVVRVPSEYDEYGNRYPADREDWVLTLSIDNISPSGFEIQIYQPNVTVRYGRSQHIGQLYLERFYLEYLGDEIPEEFQDVHMYSYGLWDKNMEIVQDVVNSFVINASEIEGFPTSLPSGSYQLCLQITDKFDPDSVHPLMKDYARFQSYFIRFEIP